MRTYYSHVGRFMEVEFVLHSRDRDGHVYSQFFKRTTEGKNYESKEDIICRGMVEGFRYLSKLLKCQLDSDTICDGYRSWKLETWWIE